MYMPLQESAEAVQGGLINVAGFVLLLGGLLLTALWWKILYR
ncbi:hypothetical protein [Halosimplex litoreum]|nr:hypothetical protein [Halosimplex litoreum]